MSPQAGGVRSPEARSWKYSIKGTHYAEPSRLRNGGRPWNGGFGITLPPSSHIQAPHASHISQRPTNHRNDGAFTHTRDRNHDYDTSCQQCTFSTRSNLAIDVFPQTGNDYRINAQCVCCYLHIVLRSNTTHPFPSRLRHNYFCLFRHVLRSYVAQYKCALLCNSKGKCTMYSSFLKRRKMTS